MMAAGLLQAYEGATIDEFERIASDFLHTTNHPTLKRPYVACGFRPMIELLQYLAAHNSPTSSPPEADAISCGPSARSATAYHRSG